MYNFVGHSFAGDQAKRIECAPNVYRHKITGQFLGNGGDCDAETVFCRFEGKVMAR